MSNFTSILSFGGGVNSTALLALLIREEMPLDQVIFADTGGELPETYAHLDVVSEYLALRSIPFVRLPGLVRGRDLYHTCLERKVIPSTLWRWSTRDFKVRPIHRYYRSLGTDINQYLAIAYDEIERMRDSRNSRITNVYPLVDRHITREQCISILRDEGLPIPVKSACFFCPYSTLGRWQWLHETHPDLYEKAQALEENSKHFPRQRLTYPIFGKRAEVPLRDLTALVKSGTTPSVEDPEPNCSAECMT